MSVPVKREYVELSPGAVSVKVRLRSHDGDLYPLEESIRKLGLLQPIIVDRNNVLIEGGRRLQACRNVGLETVSALRFDIDYNSMEGLDIQGDAAMCHLALPDEDIEKHIQAKKATMAGTATGVKSWIKRKLSPR